VRLAKHDHVVETFAADRQVRGSSCVVISAAKTRLNSNGLPLLQTNVPDHYRVLCKGLENQLVFDGPLLELRVCTITMMPFLLECPMVGIVRVSLSTIVIPAATVLFVWAAAFSGAALPATFNLAERLKTVSVKLLDHLDYSTAMLESLASSPDARHVAYVARAGTKQCVVVDGKKEKC
jgi:hypothetical protein